MRRSLSVGAGLAAALSLAVEAAWAQQGPWFGRNQFPCRRQLEVQPKDPADEDLAVATFLTHGMMDQTRDKVLVVAGNRPVPTRVLQRGPGDLCKVVFQTLPHNRYYHVYYGGSEMPTIRQMPAWTVKKGLCLEVRRWRKTNLWEFEAVKRDTEASPIVGAMFVPNVFMGGNPFGAEDDPFLIVFRGWLHVPRSGTYTFATSSVDASFIVIDDKVVCQWPGRHWVAGHSEHRASVALEAGPHRFEYYNARQGDQTFCVAAWAPPGQDPNKPLPIAPEHFGSVLEARVKSLEVQPEAGSPDFIYEIAGEALYHPLPDMAVRRLSPDQEQRKPPRPEAVVRVRFTNLSSARDRSGARIEWDFGDGQTSDQLSPEHVYLTTGFFKVTLHLVRGNRRVSATSNVLVHRDWPYAFSQAQAQARDEKEPTPLRDFMAPVRKDYDLARLDGRSLVAALEIWRLLKEPGPIVAAAKALMGRQDLDGPELVRASQLVAEALCRHSNQPAEAVKLLEQAAQRCTAPGLKAELWSQAAEVRLVYLDQAPDALAALAKADELARQANVQATRRRIQIRLGDCYRRLAKPDQARQAYAQAQEIRVPEEAEDFEEKVIGPSLLSRYIEEYIRQNALDDALLHLRLWAWLFPSAKLEGYYSLMAARYHEASQEPRLAIREINDLLAVNPESAQAGRLLWLRAQCHEDLKDVPAAVADYEQLLRDYPGDPLVPQARQALTELQKAGASGRKRPRPAERAPARPAGAEGQ